MCANYTPPAPKGIKASFGVECSGDYPEETFPGYQAPIVRLADDGSGELECVSACFGMVPSWADLTLSRHTYNARSETVAQKPSFRHAWRKRQWCIVPADAFFEPSYESGRAVRWKIAHADHSLLGIAGLWEWRSTGGPDDQPLVSFTMLTINADEHPLMRRFHRPEDEKRMVVLLDPAQYRPWLEAGASAIPDFLQPCPAHQLKAEAAPRATSARKTASADARPPHPPPRALWDEDAD